MFEAIGALAGSVASGLFGRSQQKANLKAQKEFAQHGIRWKVEDAKAAGLHPLAALGAQTHSFSPTMVGDNFSGAGQAIGRAIDSTRTHGERQEANGELGKLAVERASLENSLLRQQLVNSKIATINQAGGTPATPSLDQRYHNINGQGDAAKLIQQKPMEQMPTSPENPGQEPGAINDMGWTVSSSSGQKKWFPVPSKEFQERTEDAFVPKRLWELRNLTPGTSQAMPFKAPPGQRWTGNRYTGYYLVPGGLEGLRFERRRQH